MSKINKTLVMKAKARGTDMNNHDPKENQYVKQILNVLIYIESHIEDEITIEELAKIACYSPFHFYRIFHAIAGETVHKYVRRLRLEKAAGKLQYTSKPITDIALDSNFDTSSAFTKAFKQCMGKSPRNYRLNYKLLYKEVNAMTKKINNLPMILPEKIETIPNINILFIRRCGNYATSSNSAWEAMLAFINENKLDHSKLRFFSVFHDDTEITNEDKLRFDACVQVPREIQESGEVARKIINGGKYAIFTHHGEHQYIENTFDRIFLKWFPNSKDNFDENRPCFCEHFHLEFIDTAESKLTTKIYIPIS